MKIRWTIQVFNTKYQNISYHRLNFVKYGSYINISWIFYRLVNTNLIIKNKTKKNIDLNNAIEHSVYVCRMRTFLSVSTCIFPSVTDFHWILCRLFKILEGVSRVQLTVANNEREINKENEKSQKATTVFRLSPLYCLHFSPFTGWLCCSVYAHLPVSKCWRLHYNSYYSSTTRDTETASARIRAY